MAPCLETQELLLIYHTGNLLRGAVDSKGDLKDAALQVGIKLDLVGWPTHMRFTRDADEPFRKQRSTLLPASAVISLLGFINGSHTNFFDLPGGARAGIGTSLQAVVVGLGEIAIAFLSLTLDFCIHGSRGFAVGAITLKVTTFI